MLVMCFLVQVLFQLVQGVLTRAVAALFDQPLQSAFQAITKKRLFLFDAAYVLLLQFDALDGFVQRDDRADDNTERTDDFSCGDDGLPVDVHASLLYSYCHAIAPFTAGVVSAEFNDDPRAINVV